MRKRYVYGYKFIKPQKAEETGWNYVIQAHRNQNGLHFDFRLAKPGNSYAYSWASNKMPLATGSPILARRTSDHDVAHLDFQGNLDTAKGTGYVKILKRGNATVRSISDDGIKFQLDSGEDITLRNVSGKKYMIERSYN